VNPAFSSYLKKKCDVSHLTLAKRDEVMEMGESEGEKKNKKIMQVSLRDNPKEPLLLNTRTISLDQLRYWITT